MQGKLRRFFPGGNTSLGFYSFYDYIVEPDATRIFCLKGGPGVGKSTFMKMIGYEMLKKGYDLEFHHCSSDAASIDGVAIPSLKIALIDATAPHLVDPKFPGVIDEIIYLGDFWNEEGLKARRNEILETTKKYKRMFNIAYSSLKEAKIIHTEWESYITEAMDFKAINKITRYVLDETFYDFEADFNQMGKVRHLFGTAITPQGPISFLTSILTDIKRLYLLKGEPGSGKSTFMKKILDNARQLGLFVEAYHCPLDPEKLDFLIIPAFKIAFINEDKPLDCDLSRIYTIEIDFDHFLDESIIAYYQKEIIACQERFWNAYERAIDYLARAKELHDHLENYYIPNMDFVRINHKRAVIMERILEYARECEKN